MLSEKLIDQKIIFMLHKSLKVCISLLAILILLYACDKKEVVDVIDQQNPEIIQDNPDPSEFEPLADIKFDFSMIPDYSESGLAFKSTSEESYVMPDLLEATLRAGESITEHKFCHLASAPPLGDIMLSFDLTSSMALALNDAKSNALNIIAGVRTLVPDSYFGVMSHMDYNGIFSYCEYSNTYGGNYSGYAADYPYSLDLGLTVDQVEVASKINDLELGWGADTYEDYTRILYESYADVNIGWRPGSKKILLAWLDNFPHDCDIDLGWGLISTGVDPGRDAIAGTSDDLDFDAVLLEMQSNNISPIVITSSLSLNNQNFWKTQMQSIGGDAYSLGDDIVDQIVEIINTEFASLDEVKLAACDPAFSSWVTSEPFGSVDLSEGADIEMDVTITVPDGTAPGEYIFDICLLGDGTEYARQHVIITVVEEVPFDLHPTSCPNPLNSKAGGVLPAALLGTPDFDVSEVIVESITLEGVSPIRWSLEDVATPFEPYMDKPLDAYACNEFTLDGFEDLTLKFNNQDIVAALVAKYGPLYTGQVLKLTILGQSMDGLTFIGEDVLIVVK